MRVHSRRGSGWSDKAIGHAAASGAILIADPEQELVIVCCRYAKGAEYWERRSRFIQACTTPLRQESH